MKNFGANGRIGIFPFPCTNLHDFLVSGVIKSRDGVKFDCPQVGLTALDSNIIFYIGTEEATRRVM